MRISSGCFPPSNVLISQIERIIPRNWKQNINCSQVEGNQLSKFDNTAKAHGNLYMLDHLIISLKEFSCQGYLQKAFWIFSRIQHHVSSSGSYDLIVQPVSSLLVVCANHKLLLQGKQLHAQMFNLGLNQHPSLISKLTTMYSTCNHLYDAHLIAEGSHIMHPVPWNVVISAYVRNGLFKEALCAYKQMENMGVRPDQFTYPSVLKACGEQLDIAFGRDIHGSIKASDYERCLYVQNALISMYGKFGEVEMARQIFDNLLDRDVVSWNTMISAYATNHMWEKAIELFEGMLRHGVQVNVIIWNTMAGLLLQTGNFEGVLQLLYQMRAFGTQLDDVGMTISLSACSHIGALKLGKEIHACAIRARFYECQNIKNALITMYSRCEDFRHAYLVFWLMEDKSIIAWNSIISGYAHCDKLDEASDLFREMLLSGLKPNNVTIASVLPLCARVSDLRHGKEIHCYIMKQKGFKDHLVLWNSLIDMYARSGKIADAKKVFDLLCRKDKITYTSLMAGYGMQGEGKIALQLFEEMIGCGIEPDHITMVAVLSACSHSRLVKQGQLLFDRMLSVYGIKPCLEHFSCMVDLFGRAGLLKKALETIRMMPFQPSPEMWVTLIGACQVHGNTELGQLAAEKLLEMKPKNSGYYVLIANMYAACGCWDKLAQVRACMRDLGVGKATGYSWTDIGTCFRPFSAGDASLKLADGMNPLLEGLRDQIKDAGYIPGEDMVVDGDTIEGQMPWNGVGCQDRIAAAN